MEQVGSVRAIDENANNHLSNHRAPVRHSVVDTNSTSTQSCRHSAVKYRRRKAPESEMPNNIVSSRSTFPTLRDVSPCFHNEIDLEVASNGTLPLRVDTSEKCRHQMAHLNGCCSRKHCQNSSIDVQNAAGATLLTETSNIAESLQDKRSSDGTPPDNGIRTVTSTLIKGSEYETSPLTATNGVPVFDYSRSASDGKVSNCNARNDKILRHRSAIEYRVPNTSVSGTSLNGYPAAIEYSKSDGSGNTAVSVARNENQLVPRSESDSALAKVGDFDREREIERRMRELGLWDQKREQERHLAEMLESEISKRDGLTAALRRCRRRHRGQAASAADDIQQHVNYHFVR